MAYKGKLIVDNNEGLKSYDSGEKLYQATESVITKDDGIDMVAWLNSYYSQPLLLKLMTNQATLIVRLRW